MRPVFEMYNNYKFMKTLFSPAAGLQCGRRDSNEIQRIKGRYSRYKPGINQVLPAISLVKTKVSNGTDMCV